MDIVYGPLQVSGDFELVNIKELGYDRDFILKTASPVVNLEAGERRLQLISVARIILRASLTDPDATCHFLAAEDRQSAIANFTFPAATHRLEISSEAGQTVIRLVGK